MSEVSEKQIRIWVKRISESDQEAFDAFFRHYYPQLIRFACRYTKSKAAASDIVQESFVKLWEKRQNLDPNGSVRSYVYQIVRNRSLNYLRDHSSEVVGLETVNAGRMESTDQQEKKNFESFTGLLKSWINELPDRQREAFRLSRFEGLDHDEIAYVMDISSNTVNNHIVAALDTLRSNYNEYQKENEDAL